MSPGLGQLWLLGFLPDVKRSTAQVRSGNSRPLRYPLPCTERPRGGAGVGGGGGRQGPRGRGRGRGREASRGQSTLWEGDHQLLCSQQQATCSSALGASGCPLEARGAILERQGNSSKETPRSSSKKRTSRSQSPGQRPVRPQEASPPLCLLASAVTCRYK